MKAATPDAVLSGNGIIAAGVKPSAAFRGNLEPLQARTYANSALAGRVVVRLVQARVTEAEDASLAVLGFAAGASPIVGQAKRRAIGFPAAAIVKAPELARYALEITKDFQREARRIKSKPGHALQGFGVLAEELGRSVPAFLVSFWEEAGRAFLATGNVAQAGQCFGKARAAEDVHHLDVDEGERHEAFLEFALAGGLSIGVLADYAKTLEQRFTPADAYQRFRSLCRERVLGGQPPWGGMAKELARMAKAAKLDVAQEEATLLGEILASPAVGKAPQGFWDAYKKTLVALAKADPAWCARLLELKLKPSQAKEGFADSWLALLEATGAITALATGAPAAAQPASAAAAFDAIVKLAEATYSGFTPSGLVEVLERLAPRLVREGTPVQLFFGRWRPEWDLDALERALALGVPIREAPADAKAEDDEDDEDGEAKVYFDLSAWTEHAGEAGRGLDPEHVAADPRFAKLFADAVGSQLHDAAFQAASAGKSGFVAGKRAYFRRLIERAAVGGLIAARDLVQGLARVARPGAFDDMPEIHAELAAFEMVPALARTLRAGLPDELVWPAWEAALAKLGDKAQVLGPFPHVIVGDKRTVMVVGRDKVTYTHDVRLPKGGKVKAARFIGGDLAVAFEDKDRDDHIYWASAPTTVSPLSGWAAENSAGLGVDLPDGSWTEGSKAVVGGDTCWPANSDAISDGQTVWVIRWGPTGRQALELDTKTDARGRQSLPAFYAAQAGPDVTIAVGDSDLYPVPDGDGSPLGVKDGLAGWCVRTIKGEVEGIGIDGRTTRGRLQSGQQPGGLLDFPGHAAPLKVGISGGYRSATVHLDDPTGTFALATVTPRDEDDDDEDDGSYPWSSHALSLMPWRAWHYLRPRDLAASAVLRALSDEVAGALVAGHKAGEKQAVTEAAVKKALPEIKDLVLVSMIATRVRHAVALQTEAGELLATAAPDGDASAGLSLPRRQIGEALKAFCSGFGWKQDDLGAELRVLAKAIADPAAFVASKQACEALFTLLGQEAVLVSLAASPGYAAHRALLLDLFLALRGLNLPAAARVRARTVTGKPLVALMPAWTVQTREGAIYFAPSYDEDDDEAQLFEVALDGTFPKLPKVATKADEEAWDFKRGPSWGEEAAAVVRERGSVPWDAAIATTLAEATGLTEAEATLLWLGLPEMSSYQKNFLPKEVREAVGLKVDQAHAARDSLKDKLEHEHDRLMLYTAALPRSVEDLYTPLGSGPEDGDSPVGRLAAAWKARFGQQKQVDAGVAERAKRELGGLGLQPGLALAVFEDPASDAGAMLRVDKTWAFDLRGNVKSKDSVGFDEDALKGLVAYAAWIFHELPVGHAARAGIPTVVEGLRARTLAPSFMTSWGGVQVDTGKDWQKKVEAYLDGLGGQPLTAVGPKHRAVDLGPVRVYWPGYASLDLALVPARFGDAHADDVIGSFAGKVHSYRGDGLTLVRAALSEGVKALAARVTKTPVAAGAFELNPLVSVPKLVKEAAAALGVSADAAAYYLQLLVLPAAADARVMTLNGWSSATLEAAGAELVEHELGVTGKRARAGREVFLPGGWVDLKSPYAPMELWKMAFHGLTKAEGEGFSTPWGTVLLFEPAHALFAKAWAQAQAGDGPRFEEAGEARKAKKAKKGAK